MAFIQQEHLTTGELIGGAFTELRDNAAAVLVYLGALIALGALGELGPLAEIGGSFLALMVFFLGQYLLFETMLRNAKMLPVGGARRIFRFTGQAFVVLFAVAFATNFFVVPAFILGARWIMAPCLVVSGKCGAMGALGESWSETKGNTRPIAFAALLLMLMGYAVVMLVDGASGLAASLFGASKLFGQTLFVVPNLFFVALSVTVYRQLSRETDELAAVFA